MDRKTIAEYLRALQSVVGLQPGGPPPSDEQLTAITTVRRPRRPSNAKVPSPEFDALRPHAEQIRAWLAEGLRLTKIYRRLREQGRPVAYSSLYRFARAACDFGAPTITIRVADPIPDMVTSIAR